MFSFVSEPQTLGMMPTSNKSTTTLNTKLVLELCAGAASVNISNDKPHEQALQNVAKLLEEQMYPTGLGLTKDGDHDYMKKEAQDDFQARKAEISMGAKFDEMKKAIDDAKKEYEDAVKPERHDSYNEALEKAAKRVQDIAGKRKVEASAQKGVGGGSLTTKVTSFPGFLEPVKPPCPPFGQLE